jgi:hypothetical protein
LFHVKFEDSLSISVSRNRATRHKNWQLEIEKFKKKSSRPPTVFQPPLFQKLPCALQSVKTWRIMLVSVWLTMHVSVWLKHIQKSKVMKMVFQIGFIGWMRLW